MEKTIKITKNQPFVLWLPTIMLNATGKEEVDATSLTDVTITAKSVGGSITPSIDAYEHWLILSFNAIETANTYDVDVTATLDSDRQFQLNIKRCFEIVNWDYESNWQDYIVGDHVELCDVPFITGGFITDEEYVQLKADLREAIEDAEQAEADAEEAKQEWEEKAAELDDIATETNATANKEAILDAIDDISIDTSDLAKQGSDSTATNTAILSAIGNISIDTTTLAKQGSNAAATLTDTQAAAEDAKTAAEAIVIPTDYAKQGNDPTATNTAILNAVQASSGVPVVQMTETTATIEPNKLYIWNEVTDLTLTLATPQDTSVVNEYMFMFHSGSTATTLTLPSSVEVRGFIPTQKTICVSIINNIAFIA